MAEHIATLNGIGLLDGFSQNVNMSHSYIFRSVGPPANGGLGEHLYAFNHGVYAPLREMVRKNKVAEKTDPLTVEGMRKILLDVGKCAISGDRAALREIQEMASGVYGINPEILETAADSARGLDSEYSLAVVPNVSDIRTTNSDRPDASFVCFPSVAELAFLSQRGHAMVRGSYETVTVADIGSTHGTALDSEILDKNVSYLAEPGIGTTISFAPELLGFNELAVRIDK